MDLQPRRSPAVVSRLGKGNPGSIAQMVKMAHFPRCWLVDRIKARVLCLDYRIGRRE